MSTILNPRPLSCGLKICPKCDRRYTRNTNFCPKDGTRLEINNR